MKHAKHLLMCAPMILVAAIVLASGGGAGILFLLVGCMLMMGLMMGGMDHGESQGGQRQRHRGH